MLTGLTGKLYKPHNNFLVIFSSSVLLFKAEIYKKCNNYFLMKRMIVQKERVKTLCANILLSLWLCTMFLLHHENIQH